MPDDETTTSPEAPETSFEALLAGDGAEPAPAKKAAKRSPAKKAAPKKETAAKTAVKKAAAKTTTAKRGSAKKAAVADEPSEDVGTQDGTQNSGAIGAPAVLFQTPDVPAEPKKTAKRAPRKTAAQKAAAAQPTDPELGDDATADEAATEAKPAKKTAKKAAAKKAAKKTSKKTAQPVPADDEEDEAEDAAAESIDDSQADADSGTETGTEGTEGDGADGEGAGGARRRRRRGGRRRRRSSEASGEGESTEDTEPADEAEGDDEAADDESGEGTSRRRRRRRRTGEGGGAGADDPDNTVTRVRRSRTGEDQITAVSGSTRLEAKKQRRREGREAGRRRAPIVSEAEFLARRESVDRVMVVRQRDELTQIGVLEDKVLVEHYVARESQTSLIGNVYLGRVQNVLPSMEAAFIDIGRGRNAVLYAGEVNWSALGHKDGQPRKIESVLSSGQSVLVQVTKDPIGHKGARLTSQVSLAGRFLVYVPDGTTSGISRKLPDTERNRLKSVLKDIVPDTAGVIVRTAAEGASEDELTRDVERLKARWEDIEKKSKGSAPQLLYGEPDLTLKVVRDLFTEDFGKLVIQGDDAWETVQQYVAHMAPDLQERLEKYDPADHGGTDLFASYRLDEQIAKGLDRKVWLPSGGSLVIDRTEAMTVVDVNTGKFTGSGGNLEETVTKNNLEAAEEIVRQLRLRDIGGIIVVDFIDMVLESNRDLVLRRLVECLGRDRTRHQVAEVTSLGLVQMTRKRIGTGLLEAFSETCEHCQGRGVIVHEQPVEQRRPDDDGARTRGRRTGRGRGRGEATGTGNGTGTGTGNGTGNGTKAPSPRDIAAMARPAADEPAHDVAEPSDAGESEELDAVELGEELGKEELGNEELGNEELGNEELGNEELGSEERDGEVQDDLESLTSEVVESLDDRGDAEDDETVVPEPEPEPEPVLAAAPEKPTVVTRTRRRSASRPAGPPPPMDQAPISIGSDPDGAVGAPAADGIVEPGTADGDPGIPIDGEAGGPGHVEHVPIKRKRSRKR